MKSGWNCTAKGHIKAVEDSHRQKDSIYNRHIWESDGIQNINSQNSTSGELIVQLKSRKKACSQSHAEGNSVLKTRLLFLRYFWKNYNLEQWLKYRALTVSCGGEGVKQSEFSFILVGVRNGSFGSQFDSL